MSLKDVPLKNEYRSLIDNVIQDFYIPLLQEATVYKRAVGFFSSSSLVEITKGIAAMAQAGGKIQIVASPYNSIQHLLNNRRYMGEFRYRDTVIPDGIPAIVPKDLFERVQKKLAKNKKAPARHKAEDDYLLTTKLFCGYCGSYMCSESGTSHTGKVHHYYKCATVKKKRGDCHKKPVNKEFIEDFIVHETMKEIRDDKVIQAIVSTVMDLQEQENTQLPLYEQQLKEAETGINNLLNAIQQGILTPSTKSRLEELEATKEDLEIRIANEKLAKPKLTAEFVTMWLERFRKLDMRKKEHRQQLIDTFVNSVYLFDDKLTLHINYKDGTKTVTFDEMKAALEEQAAGSDLDCRGAPPPRFDGGQEGNAVTNLDRRLASRREELERLYLSLYGERAMLEALERAMRDAYAARPMALKRLDSRREQDPDWYRRGNMLGMTMYTDLFAGDLAHLEGKLGYLAEQGITYLHLMPLLKMPHPDNDGGYAVEDFSQVDPALGTNEDLARLAASMRRRGMSLCLDFVMNHTADTHEWAQRAKAGEQAYIDRYICFDDPDIPRQMEKTIPDVFPATAPGSFIYVPEMGKYVCSSFHPYQWDLNYKNPAVFNDMTAAMLALANLGVEVLRVDATPYLWKEMGTTCRNLPQVHTIMRMVRLVTECVCPGVILKGEVVMAPKELAPYFGTAQAPECHILYNSSTMCTQWSALASGDIRQLKHQLDELHSLDRHCVFVNYLRCHDDIGWGLNEAFGQSIGQDALLHKKYLYEFYEGSFPGSWARGERYNYDPVTQDARTCGTTASLCGIEKGLDEGDEAQVSMGIQRDLMMHAAMMAMAGFPMLSSGDEIGQLNGYDYHNDPDRAEDSRNVHRTAFNWANAARRTRPGTVQQRLWDGLRQLERIRAGEPCFGPDAWVTTWDTHNDHALALVRKTAGQTLVCLFNFTGSEQDIRLDAMEGEYTDLVTGAADPCARRTLAPYQYGLYLRADAV